MKDYGDNSLVFTQHHPWTKDNGGSSDLVLRFENGLLARTLENKGSYTIFSLSRLQTTLMIISKISDTEGRPRYGRSWISIHWGKKL